MRVFVAEKPSVGKAIAAELGVSGRGDGYLECGPDRVTWCFGHMLELAEPDEYTSDDVPRNEKSGKKIWRVEELPIIPKVWLSHPKEDAKKQVKIISGLVKSATQIINAGDPDREGQLLVDEILEYCNNQSPVLRYWASAIDSVSVRRALDDLKDNKDFHGLAKAALGRSRADWLIGMNLSRAYTLRAQRGGSRSLLTVGRVQTPTLALVVGRDKEIKAFKSIPFHTIKAEINHPDGAFWADWKAGEEQEGLDAENRLVDTAVAKALIEKLSGHNGSITEYKKETKKQNHPLTFSLSGLTALASKKFGYSAEDVLKTCQRLYETHKLTTYPRTDCAHLPESQFADAPEILAAIKVANPSLSALVDKADTNIRSRTWDDKKISAHHGIIPTQHRSSISKLDEQERNIYELVVRAYLAQFYPVHEFLSTTISLEVAGETLGAKGKVVTVVGWQAVYQDNAEEEDSTESGDNQALPLMNQGEAVSCSQATRRDTKTKPPAHFTEGTLITAMVNIHRFVPEAQHKKMLREGDGIGTEATRASIISELKRREYLTVTGKQLLSTNLGQSAIEALPEVVKSPVLTSLYERMLKAVEGGTAELSNFITKQETFIREQVTKAGEGAVTLNDGKSVPISTLHKCMACGHGLSRRPSKKKGFWWGCSKFPTCSQTYPDLKGKPDYSKGRNA